MDDICISRRLKEEQAWATDKWLKVISNIILFKTVVALSNYLKNTHYMYIFAKPGF